LKFRMEKEKGTLSGTPRISYTILYCKGILRGMHLIVQDFSVLSFRAFALLLVGLVGTKTT